MQCFDFLIEKFHELYFTPVKIPAHLKKTLDDSELEYISADGSTTCRYILLLAETYMKALTFMKADDHNDHDGH